MRSKLFVLFLAFGFFLSLGFKGTSQEVLCIHVDEKVAHFESDHIKPSDPPDEIHLKLLSDLTLKLSKIFVDFFWDVEEPPQFVIYAFHRRINLLQIPTSGGGPPQYLRTVRLLL